MKKRINKQITAKAVILFLIFTGLMLSLFLSAFAGVNEDTSENEWLSVDYYSAISDPVKIKTSYGSYYNPSAYVYFGEVYNTVTEQYEPILWRVLASDNDNNSESEAMFLLSEQAIFPNKNYTAMPEDVLQYFNDENIYTRSTLVDENIAKQIFSTDELGLIRKITKTDYAEDMTGMFGIDDWETDIFESGTLIDSSSAELLQNSYMFALSVEEVYRYVSDYGGENALAVSFETGEPVSWWLRTGFDDADGNLVGYVDTEGKVGTVSVSKEKIAYRPATNIKNDNISYVQLVDEMTYRLAFESDKAPDFSAKIINIQDGVVTISYEGATFDTTPDDKKTNSISVILEGTDGEISYYKTVATVTEESATCSFTLPDSYDEDGRLLVFWEEKADNMKSASYTSEMVGFDCIHKFSNGICSVCNEYMEATFNDNSTPDDESDDYYEIGNAGHLRWFAQQVNEGNVNINGVLISDITIIEDLDLNALRDIYYDRIWVPIGEEYVYQGIFDGRNHTVSGLFVGNTFWIGGLFGNVGEGGTVKNVITDSLRLDSLDYTGAIAIKNLPGGTIENCHNKSDLNGNAARMGGVVAYNQGVVRGCSNSGSFVGDRNCEIGGVVGYNIGGRVEGCYNTGTIKSSEDAGGVVAYNDSDGVVTECYNLGTLISNELDQIFNVTVGGVVGYNQGIVDNCYNAGEIIGKYGDDAGIVGAAYYNSVVKNCVSIGIVTDPDLSSKAIIGSATEDITVENCYYLIGSATSGMDNTYTADVAVAVSSEILGSGKIAYLLQAAISDTDENGNIRLVWGQSIGEDPAPIFGGTRVNYGYTDCCHTQPVPIYTNLPVSSTKPEHSFEIRGTCVKCGDYQDATLNGEYYEIKNPGQLMWFAQTVNSGESLISARLIADIDMNGFKWTAIATTVPYNGIFDGQGFTIKNLNKSASLPSGSRMELFVRIGADGVVKNLVLSGANIFSDNRYETNGSGMIACESYGLIHGVIVKDSVIYYGDFERLGGIVGLNNGTVSSCAVVNSVMERVYGAEFVGNMGGIAQTNNGTVKDCFVYDVSFSRGGANTASIIVDGEAPINCYYYTTHALMLNYGTEMKPDQFKNGEVAYLIGSDFGQEIGKDVYPVPNGMTVYKNQIGGCTEDSFVYEYSNVDQTINTHLDENNDHVCDRECGVVVGEHIAAIGKHTCDHCGESVTDCIPNADDGDCTTEIKCSICDAVTTEGASAHTGGTATCTAKAKCAACGKEYGDIIAHAHTTEWKNDADSHWNECACGDKSNVASHEDSNSDEKCDACGKDMPTISETDSVSDTDDFNAGNTEESTNDADGLGTGAIVAIAVGSTVVGGAGIFALVWFVIKKKTRVDADCD